MILMALDEQKNIMIGALWSNSNWDDTDKAKGHRQRMISAVVDDHKEAVGAIEKALNGGDLAEEEKIDESNPFFAASKRGLEKVDKRIADVKSAGGKINTDDQPDYMKDLDQG